MPATDAHSLLEEAEPGSRFRVVQIDEEPSELLAQLIVLGLEPGKEVEVQAQDAAVLKVVIAGGVVPLANAVAMHIRVMPAPMLPVPLGELSVGARARVVEIQGTEKHQRRMLDIGFVPGAHITVVRKAPLGDPVAYRVKETAIALRREDAGTM